MEKLYLIKDTKGRVFGPYSESEIISSIEKGDFKGEESFASYPAGKFRPLSAHPAFYEKILLRLDQKSAQDDFSKKPGPEGLKEQTGQESIEPTKIINLKKPPGPSANPRPSSQKIRIKLSREFKEDVLNKENTGQIIEMEGLSAATKRLALKNLPKKTLFYIAGAAAAVILSVLFSVFQSEKQKTINPNKPIRLLSIKGAQTIEPKKRKETITNGVDLFLHKSSIANYTKAMGIYTSFLRDRSDKKDFYIHLCLIYLKLWPFAYQDTEDKNALKELLNRISQKDKEGVYAGACKSIEALIKNKPKKALMTVDSSLNALKISKATAFFYYIKARALQDLRRKNEAALYFKKAYSTEEKWIAPYVMRAHILYDKGEYDTAGRLYQTALSRFPKQPSAQLRLGILEYTRLNRKSSGALRIQSLLSALNSPIPPNIMIEAHLALTDFALAENNQKEGLKHLNQAYALDPNHPDTVNRLAALKKKTETNSQTKFVARGLIYKGDVLASQGQCIKAQNYFRQAFSAGSKGLAALKMAQCYWQVGASGQAVQWLKSSINTDRNQLSAYFLLADYLSRLYDFEGAYDILKTAKSLKSQNNYDLYKAYSLISFRQKQYRATISYAERALNIYTFDAEIYILLSQAWHALGEGDKAFRYAEKAVQEDMNSIQAQIGYARALDLAYGFSRSEKYFKKLIDQFPLVIEYSQACGEFYFDKGKYDKALEQFTQTIEKNPKFKHAYIYRGRTLSYLSRAREGGAKGRNTKFRLALKDFLQAALLDPGDPDPVFYAGLTYMNHNELKAAEGEFSRILKKINANYPLIHYYLASVNFRQEDKDKTIKALKFARTQMEKTPHHFLPYKLAGDIYRTQAQGVFTDPQKRRATYELCVKEYQKALSRRKNNMEISIRLMECYKGTGDLDSALQLGLRMTQKQGLSGYPEFYKEIAGIYEAKDEYEKARAYYTDYFSLHPGAKDYKEISERIERLIQEKNSISQPGGKAKAQ